MAGAVEQSIYQSAQKHGLDMELFIGLAAVPPLPFVMQSGPFDTNIIRKDYLADRSKLAPWFAQQIAQQNALNGHIIIPKKTYLLEFIGDIPAGISAEGYYLHHGKLKKNNEITYQDSGVFNFSNTPWIALIVDDSSEDTKISLINPYSWNFIRAEMLYQRYVKPALNTKKWTKIKDIMNKIPEQLIATVHGTHFFFIGEKGAQRTASQIKILTNRVIYYKTQLDSN